RGSGGAAVVGRRLRALLLVQGSPDGVFRSVERSPGGNRVDVGALHVLQRNTVKRHSSVVDRLLELAERLLNPDVHDAPWDWFLRWAGQRRPSRVCSVPPPGQGEQGFRQCRPVESRYDG